MIREFHLPESVLAREESFPSSVFARHAVDLEIGCGVGLHPILWATEHPERHLIAIEHTKEKFEKFARRKERHPHLENLTPIHANAISWVSKNVPVESIETVFILYPNPNPKRKSQRWFWMPFMHRLVDCLRPGGRLILATNIESYAHEAIQQASSFGLRLECQRELTRAAMPRPRTHFERKYLERGETCYDLVFRKAYS